MITSSKISSAPVPLQIVAQALEEARRGGTTPMLPATGSTITRGDVVAVALGQRRATASRSL